MGKKKKKRHNYLSFRERALGAVWAVLWAGVVWFICQFFTPDALTISSFRPIPSDILQPLLVAAVVNIVYYILINWFAAKGGIPGIISFCLCLLLDIVYLIYYFFCKEPLQSFACFAAVPFLLHLYVIDYVEAPTILGGMLNGYKRQKYGFFTMLIVGIISMLLYYYVPDKGLQIGKIVGLALHLITLISILRGIFPFAREEFASEESSGSGSSSCSSAAANRDYGNDRVYGGREKLEKALRNMGSYNTYTTYVSTASYSYRTRASLHKNTIYWDIEITNYRDALRDATYGVKEPELIQEYAERLKSIAENLLREVQEECISKSNAEIESLREKYNDLDNAFYYEFHTHCN